MGLTETMRRELDELGFTVLEGLLRGPELQRVAASVRAVAEHGDSGVVAPIALEMMAHEPVTPYLVDAMGYNIHMRDGLFACYPPNTNPVDFGRLGTGWHIDQQEVSCPLRCPRSASLTVWPSPHAEALAGTGV